MEITFALAEHNKVRFMPSLPRQDWRSIADQEYKISQMEIEWVESLRPSVQLRAQNAPTEPEAFLRWFSELSNSGPGQNDPLFPWLQTYATHEQMRWFIFQEVAGEAGFDDLVALTQVKMETRPKLEMARNYWDEMGRGQESGMHGPMLERTAKELHFEGSTEALLGPAVDLANLMSAFAHHRQYAYHSVGALGAIELTAPTRTNFVYKALRRTGLSPSATHYFSLHTAVDVKHSAAWNAEVLAPIVAKNPETVPAIAEGALLRLEAGAACFKAYRAHFESQGAVFGS